MPSLARQRAPLGTDRLIEQDVFGLQIPVRNTLRVAVRERGEHLAHDTACLVHRQCAPLLEHRLKRHADIAIEEGEGVTRDVNVDEDKRHDCRVRQLLQARDRAQQPVGDTLPCLDIVKVDDTAHQPQPPELALTVGP
eukprot:scaffold47486_cov26-Tisochrysis_lutea.AAC.1